MSSDLYVSLGSPKHLLAPMVDQSEYAWRVLSMRYNSHLVYTPMFNARLFAESEHYRTTNFTTGPHDGPLIVQFCANKPEYLLAAAKIVQESGTCVAVDLNLGCPQAIAKRGHYGSFLMNDLELVKSLVETCAKNLVIPITCKIRIFPDVDKTLEYAKMLQAAGCVLLVVHGRLREQKGHNTGLADWEQIRRVKAELDIPVIANGNILYYSDVERCMVETGVDGVMIAEGNLYNPALFADMHLPSYKIAREYLDICREIPGSATTSNIRSHLFKLFHAALASNTHLRTALASTGTLDGFYSIVDQFEQRYKPHVEAWDPSTKIGLRDGTSQILDYPEWVCQPYIRPQLPAQPSDELPEAGKKRKNRGPSLIPQKARRIAQIKLKICTSVPCANIGSDQCQTGFCKGCCKKRAAAADTDSIPCEFHSKRKRRKDVVGGVADKQVKSSQSCCIL